MKVISLQKKIKNHKSKKEVEDLIKEKRKEDEVPVKGMFEFVDAEGGFFEFTYRIYPGDPIQTYQFIHGEICEIPMGIVKHLNNTYNKIRRYKDVEQTESGTLRKPRTFETKSRIRFIPSEYL